MKIYHHSSTTDFTHWTEELTSVKQKTQESGIILTEMNGNLVEDITWN